MSLGARLAVLGVRAYQIVIGPVLPPACRFYPSCSEYAAGAIAGQGLLRGLWLATKRLARCHPLHPGGYDPPPARARDAAGERED